MAEVVPISKRGSVADEKARLLREGLRLGRAVLALDEADDDLDEATMAAWLEKTVPDSTDARIVYGEIEVELLRRQGALVLRQGEQRGGSEPRGVEVGQRPTLTEGEKDRRKRARLVASEPAAVNAYLERERKAKRAPSARGAVRAAKAARVTTMPKASHQRRSFEGRQTRVQNTDADVIVMLDTLADGVRRTDKDLAKMLGKLAAASSFLARVRLIPWLTVDRNADGTMFTIDDSLRAICDGRAPRPALSFQSWVAFHLALRAELKSRREANNDPRNFYRGWRSEMIIKRQQTDLLDWIEEQLDRVRPLTP